MEQVHHNHSQPADSDSWPCAATGEVRAEAAASFCIEPQLCGSLQRNWAAPDYDRACQAQLQEGTERSNRAHVLGDACWDTAGLESLVLAWGLLGGGICVS